MPFQNLTGVPSAVTDLGLGLGSQRLTPAEELARKKKLMAAGQAGGNDAMSRYGNAAMALFGARPTGMI